jgi:hypothetical protein
VVEELRNAVQVVGSLAAILVLVFGAARYFGRKDERETVTARRSQ